LKKLVKDYLLLLIVAGIIVILDQCTKTLVRINFKVGVPWTPWPSLTPFVGILHIHNTGVAFGMFQGANTIFSILAIIVSLAIIIYFPRVPRNEGIIRLALAMMLAGAVGNLIDRIHLGYVTDFISVGTFAIFNVADASITTGVGVLLLGVWLQEHRRKGAEKGNESSLEPSETHDQTGTGD
jgi:signal peptidase II